MKTRIASYLIISGLVLSVTGCNTMDSTSGSTMSKSTAMADKPLYDRLGGKPAITAVVDDFVGRVAADSRINGKFANTDIPRLKMLLVEQNRLAGRSLHLQRSQHEGHPHRHGRQQQRL